MTARLMASDDIMELTVDDAVAIARGDNVGIVSGLAVPASETTWDTDLATTQEAFHDVYAGVAMTDKVANDGNTKVLVRPRYLVEFDCAAATFTIGALVGAAKQTGNGLENQKVVSVATPNLACGRVAKHYGSNTTKVLVMVEGNLYGGPKALA